MMLPASKDSCEYRIMNVLIKVWQCNSKKEAPRIELSWMTYFPSFLDKVDGSASRAFAAFLILPYLFTAF